MFRLSVAPPTIRIATTPGCCFRCRAKTHRRPHRSASAHVLPFTGIDRWHAWELSWLNAHGKPEVAIGRFDIPVDSPCMVESKSLKLYLNSYNNERWFAQEAVRALIETDLSAACQLGRDGRTVCARCAADGSSAPEGESIDGQDTRVRPVPAGCVDARRTAVIR
jgi:7-cyano-7-deazaguanine reductase